MWRGSAGDAVLAAVGLLWGTFLLIYAWRKRSLPPFFGEPIPATSCLFLLGLAGAIFCVCFGIFVIALHVA